MTKRKAKRRGRKRPLAETADRHDLYQRSVQNPPADVYFINKIFRRHRKRRPLSFKEDFCGTAFLSATWVESHKQRTAIGVDLDQKTLDWGQTHNIDRLKRHERDRITLVRANVLDMTDPKVDVTCALNFSYCVFKKREDLLKYFRVAYRGLTGDGIFFCELYGGTEAIIELEEDRECGDFKYVWEQEKYNAITSETLCHIHFVLEDRSRMERAFTYDWRLWTIPEVKELLLEAGFQSVEVWWDPVDGDPKGDEWYRKTEDEENQEGWLVYFAAIK